MRINAIFHGSLDSIFETKICNIFLIYSPNIGCGCLFITALINVSRKSKRNNVYPCKPIFTIQSVVTWGAHCIDWLTQCKTPRSVLDTPFLQNKMVLNLINFSASRRAKNEICRAIP